MSGSTPFPGGKSRGPLRRVLAVGAGLLGLVALLQCSQEPKPARDLSEGAPPKDGELRFDERYLDSLSAPPSTYSARTWRQLAIRHQLARLEMASRPFPPDLQNDSVSERVEAGGPVVKFPNEAASLADIYHRIDSLKVLEGLPVTPHPPSNL
ncbi:hypothetical protein [Hymenobacter terrenus]|uniref:hypothetical protein n=1 Tax=Hymenobacter terrenus TaxID=1629124 RepID=UPI0006198F07|nr:hypothetical protein [Hymenobacter terrenus]